jgi:vacuolar-type H+-ATPase subunit I/STV1
MDFYARYPDKPDSAYCSGCHTLKQIADFKRRATLSEARNWTKNPELKRPILYEGKLCNACHRRRKPSELSPEELRKRLVNEGANPLKIQAQVEAHYAKGKASRRQKQTKARAQKYEAQYNAMLKDTAEQLRKTSEHLRYARRSSKPDDYIESLEETVRNLRTQRDQIKAARLNGRDPTSLCASTQNPAVPLSTSKGE